MSVRKLFEEELSGLKTELVEMCRLTEQMINNAITALVNRDRELGKSVGLADKRVDEYEMDIEKRCMRILLRQQPVAKDFREVSTALKMITDIERFGDQASDIGDLVYTMPGERYIKNSNISPPWAISPKNGERERGFVHKQQRGFGERSDRARRQDGRSVFNGEKELIELIKKDGANGDQAIELMMVAKYLEG